MKRGITMNKKLKLEDLHKGMEVNTEQLSDILDTYIILKDVHLVKNNLGIGSFEGTIDDISTQKLRLTKPNSTLVYNDSYSHEPYCEYE